MTKDTTVNDPKDHVAIHGKDEAVAYALELLHHAGATPPSIAAVVALAQTFEAKAADAYECAGWDPSDDAPKHQQAPTDPQESEDYGAGIAWDEAAAMLRRVLGEGDLTRLGTEGRAAFSTHALVQTAADLLAAIARREGAGSSLCDAAEDAVAVLARGGFAGDRSVSANDLLDLCGRIVEDVSMGDYGASAASLMFSPEQHTGHLGMASLASDLRNASRIVR